MTIKTILALKQSPFGRFAALANLREDIR